MHILIYGEDTYRSRDKLRAISQKYIDTNLGDTNLANVDGAKTKGDEIIRQLWIMPFLATKRLVIVNNLISLGSKDAQNAVQDFLPKLPETTIAVFYETEKIDKRSTLFKSLNKSKFSEEYVPLDPFKLRQWLMSEFQKTAVPVDPPAVDFLIKNIGPDLWRLHNEISKLSAHSPDGITVEHIKEIVHLDPSGDIFQLIDSLAKRDLKTAVSHLKGRLHAGDHPIYLFTMFAYGFRTLLIVQDFLKRNPSGTSISGMHPLVFKKTSAQVKSFSQASLKAIYEKLRDLDYDIKTGIIDPEVALDVFIFELCLGSLRES